MDENNVSIAQYLSQPRTTPASNPFDKQVFR